MLYLSSSIEGSFERWAEGLNLTALERQILRHRVLSQALTKEELDLAVKLVTKAEINVNDVARRNSIA